MFSTEVNRTIITIGFRLLATILTGTFEIILTINVKSTMRPRASKLLHIKIETINTTVRIIFILASILWSGESTL